MKIQEIYDKIDEFAPFSTAMEYDNVGILLGSGNAEVTKVVVSLDATMETLEYALGVGAELVVTHHPVIFHPLKRISQDSVVYQYIRHGVSVLSAHTNLDMAKGGLNDLLAKRLDLQSVAGFDEISRTPYRKIALRVRQGWVDTVMAAMAGAGAESFSVSPCQVWADGGMEGGASGTPMVLLETVCAPETASAVLREMLQSSPDPHPFYDVTEDAVRSSVVYSSRMGVLPVPLTPDGLLSYVKERLGLDSAGLVCREGMEGYYLNRIGVCSGAGGSLLYACARQGIEALITSEIKHNVAQDALEMGIVMIDAGHYGTEILMVPAITRKLEREFPQLEILPYVQQQPLQWR